MYRAAGNPRDLAAKPIFPYTSSRTDELDQRCFVSDESPLGQSILSGKRFGLFLAPQYADWTSG